MKEFKRTVVPLTERVISWLLLLLLGVIGFAVWKSGQHFDPGKFALRAEALQSTTEAVSGKAATLRAETDTAPPTKDDALDIRVTGLKPQGATEFYSPGNLYEKIDGRAPAYVEFRFQQLRCRSFSVEGANGSFVDVFEYRMDSAVNAFGIFALERDPKGKPLDFAADGYASEMGFFFRQGNCYVQIIASDQNLKTMELARAVAADRAHALPADDAGLEARHRLPASGQVAGTITYVHENAQGQAFLKDVFQATYEMEGASLPFFVMVTTPDAAAAAWKSYQEFYAKFGAVTPLPAVNGAQIFRAETFGTIRVVYQRAGELGGAEGDKAEKFVHNYLQATAP